MIRQWAQHYFNREFNAWTVGYYDSMHHSPNAWTTYRTEEAAKAEADRYNAQQPKAQ